jgi:hypothetical protein
MPRSVWPYARQRGPIGRLPKKPFPLPSQPDQRANVIREFRCGTTTTAVYACINGGGNHPQAANKETINAEVSVAGSFEPKNGRVVASLSAGPPSAGSFSCPNGQRLVLASVSYTNIVLTDTTNNVTTSVPDASRTLVNV